MHVVSSVPEGLPNGLYSKIAHYRHKVFVKRLGWPLQTQNGIELDQFDRPDTVYVVAQDDEGCIVGCARLLPTTRPYLLGEVFPQLLNGLAPPSMVVDGHPIFACWIEVARFGDLNMAASPLG